jgi:multiple antibiotic resistance protein
MSRAEWLNFFFTSFISLFAIVNPLGNATLFLTLTEGKPDKDKQRVALRAAITSLLILLAFIFLGKQILVFFRITIPAFQIAGGILIFIIGVTMLHAFRLWVKSTPTEEQAWAEKQDVGVIPLGIPILTGPGAITTAMVLVFQQTGIEARMIVCAAAVLVCLIAFLVFSQSTYLLRLLGDTGINIFTRLMGLLLTVMAVQFFINGLKAAFPLFGGH